MGDEKNRAAMDSVRKLFEANDISAMSKAMDEYASEDLVEEWPQSGERIRGRANIKKLNEGYGAATGKEPKFKSKRLIGGGDVYVVEGTIDYGDGVPVSYVGIGELRDGKIVKITEYFANPFEAPAWRADVAERMDKVLA
ncbi:MAG: nuclear transport factor 2 family protein [Chloroflexota bacterium]|nr:nuclear transport factor 2 family protein [Chloroflexota bacterium]